MRYAPRPDCEPYYGGQHIHQSCIASEAEERTNFLSYNGPFGRSSLPGRDTPCSLAPLAEPDAWKTVGQIKDEYLGYFNKPDFITVKADISFISTERFLSAACTLVVNGKQCNVEASGNVDGMWHGKRYGQSFESCDYGTWHSKRCRHSFGSCDYGYLVHIQIQDHTGMTSATAYREAAKEIFGCTAEDLYLMENRV
jgi:replication factor A1